MATKESIHEKQYEQNDQAILDWIKGAMANKELTSIVIKCEDGRSFVFTRKAAKPQQIKMEI